MPATKIWDGTQWRDLGGSGGGGGSPSTDEGNFVKLGTDDGLLVAESDLDARYVNVTGDTMTGNLRVNQTQFVSSGVTVSATNTPSFASQCYGSFGYPLATGGQFWGQRARGSAANPQPVGVNDRLLQLVAQGCNNAGSQPFTDSGAISAICTVVPTGSVADGIQCAWQITCGGGNGKNGSEIFYGNATGVNIRPALSVGGSAGSVPAMTRTLEVGGTAIVRGAFEATGNITSAGTAHSFAARSIPSSAVIGNTPQTIAATGSAGVAGQMVWDDNFLYLHTTGGWKKVALAAI